MPSITLLRSKATGLFHVFGPAMKKLGAVGKHPQRKTLWAIAHGNGSRIEFEAGGFNTREGAIQEVLTRHGLAGKALETETPPPPEAA